jgi:hypothetical protein
MIHCKACNSDLQPKILKLPNSIFIRLSDKTPMNDFNRTYVIRIGNYFVNRVIQYSKSRQHFRTIKFFGKAFTIVEDNDKI